MAQDATWIAVVDDDPAVLKALKRLLRSRALHARIYGSAQEFLATVADELPQCLIADLQMPGMTGLELLQHLKRSNVHIPTIIITAHGDAGVRERCEAAGAIAFLLKPLQDVSLFAAIDHAHHGAEPSGRRR